MLSFVGVAGLYILLEAEFLAMVQILVYVGAISILIIFAIMLSRRMMSPDVKARNEQWLVALVAAVALFAILAFILLPVAWPTSVAKVPRTRSLSWARPWLTPTSTYWSLRSPLCCCWWPWSGPSSSPGNDSEGGTPMQVPLEWYLVVAAALFCIGLYGALSRRNAIAILMGVELMLNSVNINLLAFWRHIEVVNATLSGQVFAIIVITVAAAEAAVGLALIIAVYRNRHTVDVEDIDLMKL